MKKVPQIPVVGPACAITSCFGFRISYSGLAFVLRSGATYIRLLPLVELEDM
jgi:hypothetical protein